MRRTKEQAAVTRQTILRVAEELFCRHGYDDVTLDQIAEAAGVKRGAVHFHFLNKVGIVVAICEDCRLPTQELLARLERERPTPLDDLADRLSETLRSFHGDERRKHIVRTVLRLGSKLEEIPEEVRDFERRLFVRMLDIFEVAAERGQLREPWTARSGALAVHSLMMGLLTGWARGALEVELVPDGVEAIRRMIATVKKDAPPAARPTSHLRTRSARTPH